MYFEGRAIHCSLLPDTVSDARSEKKVDGKIAELQFNLKDDSVNKLNALTLRELREVVTLLQKAVNAREVSGVLLTSGKDCFIVGADITEFLGYFEKSEEELMVWLKEANQIFSDLEDLECPTVSAINGFALGGGFETTLATSYRVMAQSAKVGLPETKLGIYPGWGGTVRFSRLVGADNAIEWIASGEQWNAEVALKIGAVDAVVPVEQVRDASLQLLKNAILGKMNWKARRTEKTQPLHLNPVEATLAFESAKAFVSSKAGPNYPAPLAAIEAMQKGATQNRNQALVYESAGFARMAKTSVAQSLVSIFLGDQFLKKQNKKMAQSAPVTEMAAVLGAGIMGGGIAYQSASRGVPIYMKDIAPASLDLGMKEAVKLLDKQVSRKKMTPVQMGEVLGKVRSTLSYGDFGGVDCVVEAVVENEKVKKAVLTEVESLVKPGTLLTSNTSTISISRLAEGLKHPENFCGMHFFNPVHRMPLVEIIRGEKSSESTIARAVAYATKMGKTSIVVNDCPGFLINRVLFPYFAGFIKLIDDGVDFQRIDRVMEKWGWPMGPAYLLDVVGIDTAQHANTVMAQAYPDRMTHSGQTAIQVMYESKRYGQKNSKGFYSYKPNKKGAPQKEVDLEAYEILKPLIVSGDSPNRQITDEEIVDRMMLPMIIESSRCLEDKIVQLPVEVDLGLVYGLGFPPFRGGLFRFVDHVGTQNLCQNAEKYKHLGKLYEPTEQMLKLAQSNRSFY